MQFLDINGLNYYTGKLKDGTLKVGASSSADKVPASGITGIIDISHIPAAAIERLTVVADDDARLALTESDIQLGDTVKVTSTGKMYFVKNTSSLGTEDAFEEYRVGTASQATYAETANKANSVEWTNVSNKPSEYTPSSHNHSSSNITSMSGYIKASSVSAISTSDTLNNAIGKLEKYIENVNTSVTNIQTIDTNTIDSIIAGSYTA